MFGYLPSYPEGKDKKVWFIRKLIWNFEALLDYPKIIY